MNDTYLSCPDVNDPDAFAARVHGDAMAPKFWQNDIVIFSPLAPIEDGDAAYVELASGATTFRRVFFQGNMLRLEPNNPSHPPLLVARDDVERIARAVFRYAKV